MPTYNVTSFEAESSGKRAFSPFRNNTFEFKTFKMTSLEGILKEASQSFISKVINV